MTRGKSAFERAFPERDSAAFVAAWTKARGAALSTSLVFLARWLIGRPSRFLRLRPELHLPAEGPFVIAALHYSIDPLVQLSCISDSWRRDLLWAVYPLRPTVEDDRELWLTGTPVPGWVTKMFLPVTDRSWIVRAASHLRRGGGVFVAIDAPFDSMRSTATPIRVGEATIPLSPSVEFLFGLDENVQLLFAAPRRGEEADWSVDLIPVPNLDALVAAAEIWIASNQLDWAGWPHILWRGDAEEVRRKAAAVDSGATPR
ncbi:MAG TPA: hypothetical protein VFJ57_00940 [Solirubrobacterales bacterium]|nr:hypothetical protein [Solirubrobacterales bacterium]